MSERYRDTFFTDRLKQNNKAKTKQKCDQNIDVGNDRRQTHQQTTKNVKLRSKYQKTLIQNNFHIFKTYMSTGRETK